MFMPATVCIDLCIAFIIINQIKVQTKNLLINQISKYGNKAAVRSGCVFYALLVTSSGHLSELQFETCKMQLSVKV